jgi:hypothetical protein
VLELLEAIRSGGDIDAIRQGAELVYEALIEAEASEQIGAARYERTRRLTETRPPRSKANTRANNCVLPCPGPSHVVNGVVRNPVSYLQVCDIRRWRGGQTDRHLRAGHDKNS